MYVNPRIVHTDFLCRIQAARDANGHFDSRSWPIGGDTFGISRHFSLPDIGT
jgi:hypothetical protein